MIIIFSFCGILFVCYLLYLTFYMTKDRKCCDVLFLIPLLITAVAFFGISNPRFSKIVVDWTEKKIQLSKLKKETRVLTAEIKRNEETLTTLRNSIYELKSEGLKSIAKALAEKEHLNEPYVRFTSGIFAINIGRLKLKNTKILSEIEKIGSHDWLIIYPEAILEESAGLQTLDARFYKDNFRKSAAQKSTVKQIQIINSKTSKVVDTEISLEELNNLIKTATSEVD